VVTEPVRGRVPDPHLYALSGMEWLRAFHAGRALLLPLNHLTGATTTGIEVGAMVGTLPELGWFQLGDDTVDIRFVCALGVVVAGLTMAPPATKVRLASLAVDDLRFCTLAGKALTVRGRVVHSGTSRQIAEVSVDDARGRTVGRAIGRILLEPMPTPPAAPESLPPVEEPVYATPDPYLRPVPHDSVLSPDEVDAMGGWLQAFSAVTEGAVPQPPICDLFGIRFYAVREGFAAGRMPASEWLIGLYPNEIFSGCLATLAHLALSLTASTLIPPGHGLQSLGQSLSFLKQVPSDGRDVTAQGSVIHEGEFLVATVEITDADGHQVALGSQTSRTVPRARRHLPPDERVFATVLFTDIVGSTGKANQMGDTHWRELLEQHHRVVRAQLQAFKGREVKTTGDGFLATFDSPTRAVQCTRTIRDGLRRLGLEVRAGLHTGEYQTIGGDIAGVAVHVASRVQSLAGPGEILVSNTVHDLVKGSGLRFADRGRHQLKGIDGYWPLFAVEG
jgi:class 3 adenylate cyclase